MTQLPKLHEIGVIACSIIGSTKWIMDDVSKTPYPISGIMQNGFIGCICGGLAAELLPFISYVGLCSFPAYMIITAKDYFEHNT